MFKNFFKNFILGLITFQLTIGSSLAYADPISTQERTNDLINDFLRNATPSDLPFVDYLDSFTHDKIQPIKQFDLSSYNGKQIYVGYGVFDQDQKYCKYVEQPGLDPVHNASDKITTYFTSIGTFNKHSYAMSINKMTFQECQDKVDHFGGYIATPTSLAENGFLSGRYSGDKWLGIERLDCSDNNPYMNQEGKQQEYFKWSKFDDGVCDETKLHIKQNSYGTWQKQSGSETNYCVIEVNSEDINRPVKFCAPWWRIERDYKKDTETDYGGVNIYRINQADIPNQSIVCTHMDPVQIAAAAAGQTRRITCTEYYDATMAPECLLDPLQPQCFVDECEGYVENACVHVQEIEPLKDYTKTKALIDGQMQWIKGKDRIRTEVYDCPPSPPSQKSACLETSTVITYPKECPGSQCDALKECVYNAQTQEQKDDCYDQYTCKKIYGSPDMPVYDENGELTHLLGYCTDENGHNIEPALEFPINIQSKHERKCLEYADYNITEQVNQNCTLERPYNDYTVEMSLTAQDVYEDNPMCIRMNNLFDARPLQEMALTYKTLGYAKLIIQKAFINSEEETTVDDGIQDYVMTPDQMAEQETESTADNTVQVNTETIDCSDFSESWAHDLDNKLHSGTTSITSSTYDGSFSDVTKMKLKFLNVQTEQDCIDKKNTYGDSYSYDQPRQVCEVFYTKSSEDRKFKLIIGSGPTDYQSETNIAEDECERYSLCLGGDYNTADYTNGGTTTCKIHTYDSWVAPESEPTLEAGDEAVECKPDTTEGSLTTDFDGNRDIFAIQEVVGGDFGYYSNHTTWYYQSDIVTYEDKQLFPIKPVSTIEDPLVYKGVFTQISILTKSPNILAGAIGGAAAGAAAAAYVTAITTLTATGIGILVVVVFVIVAAIMGPKKKYNEQYEFWIIYKMVPVERYIDNIYGYDYRIMDMNDDGTRKIYTGNKYKLIYARYGEDPNEPGYTGKSFTGTLEPGDFTTMINNWFKDKQQMLMCYGWEKSSVPQDQFETSVGVPYPSCSSLSWSCNKRNTQTHTPVVDPFMKTMTNYYKGAVNTVSIVVPYLGDYEVKAYDRNDNLIGDIIVYESEFIGAANNIASYAQVMFGLNMDIATEVHDGTTSGACRYDLMTEWGGGVSGVYYENDFTGMYTGCDKSNDYYVQDHSATKLTLQSLGEDKAFVINLNKPMPFANRVFLVTLGEKEVRKYRCYDDFGDCQDEDYVTEGDE